MCQEDSSHRSKIFTLQTPPSVVDVESKHFPRSRLTTGEVQIHRSQMDEVLLNLILSLRRKSGVWWFVF